MRQAALWLTWGLAGITALAQTTPPPAATPPAQPAPPASPVYSFDPAKVELARHDRRWQLVHQGHVLKDFGPSEPEARLALRLIRELKLDGHGTVGGEARPLMEYWLSNGEAPRGAARGLRGVPLEPGRLRVEQVRGIWCLRDGPRVLFTFGDRADAAREALAVLQRHHFDHIAYVGQVAPSMYVFLRRPHDDSPALPARGGRQIEVPRLSRVAKQPDGTPKAAVKAPNDGPVIEQIASPVVPPLRHAAPTRDWRSQPRLTPAQVAPPANHIVFDWRQAQLRQLSGEWVIQAGTQTLARFGGNMHAGQLALSALRHYRFTEGRRVGDPAVVMYLPTAQSPRGVLLGLPSESFQPEQLAVKPIDAGRFALVHGQRVVLSMGGRKDDAEKLLKTVQAQGYDRFCQLGDPASDGMAFFVRSR